MRTEIQQYGANFASRIGRLALSVALVIALVPSAALADDDTTSSDSTTSSSSTYTVGEGDQGKQVDLGIADQTFEYDSDGDGETDSSEIIWGDGEWTSYDVTDGTGTAVWSTYIKGDNSHYGHYDAQFTFTVENYVLTSVDLSSQGTTFGGVWGNISKSTTITGYLPTGVTNETSVEYTTAESSSEEATEEETSEEATDDETGSDATTDDESNSDATTDDDTTTEGTTEDETSSDATTDDTTTTSTTTGATVTLALSGTDSIGGYSVSSATLYQVAADGGLYELDSDGNIVYEEVYDESDGDTDTVAVSLGSEDVTSEASEGTVTVSDVSTDTGYGLLEVTYTIGSYYKFTQYTALNGYGELYEITDTDFWAEPDGIGEKNRDQYTALAYQIIVEQELASFVEDLNSETEIEGAAEVDVVSGATKSSDAIVEAIYAALGYDYPITNQGDYISVEPTADEDYPAIFTSVSDDLEITMDANTGDNYTAENGVIDASDGTTVSVDADGNYVVTAGLSDNTDIVALSSVALYGYSDDLTDAESVELGVYSAAIINGETDYEGADEYLAGTITSNTANHGFAGELDSCDITDSDGNVLATYDSSTRSLTVYSSKVTHVAFGYAQAKKTESVSKVRLGILGFAYDLQAEYESNPTVAGYVEQIDELTSTNEALTSENETLTSANEILTSENETLTQTVESLTKEVASLTETLDATTTALYTIYEKNVTVANVTYTGKTKEPTITVKGYDGSTLTKGTDYTVSYAKSTRKNVGTYSVTITGTGSYSGTVTTSYKVTKASQSLKVSTATKSVKYSKVKKASTKTSKVKVSGAKGTVTYKKASGSSSKLSINSKTGKITVKKGTKKGTYKIKVKVTSKATSNYAKATKTVTVKVKVK